MPLSSTLALILKRTSASSKYPAEQARDNKLSPSSVVSWIPWPANILHIMATTVGGALTLT